MKLGSVIDTVLKIKLDSIKVDTSLIMYRSIAVSNETLILGIPENLARILIPVSSTIFIFFLGHFIAWLKSKFERKREIDSFKSLILEWIELSKKPIETQILSCNTFAEELEKSEDMTSLLFNANKLLAEKIDTLPLEKMINAFSVNTDGDKDQNYKMTYNLVSHFNFFKHVEKSIEITFEGYNKFFDEIVVNWNSKFNEFDDIISIHSKEIANVIPHPYYKFHLEVLKITKAWLASAPKDKNSIRHLEVSLINPLINFTALELETNQSDYAFKLSSVMRDLKIHVVQWDNAKRANAGLFKSIAKNMGSAYKKLEEVRIHFKDDTKTVGVFSIR